MTAMPSEEFVMHGARDAIAAGLGHIEEHVKALERAIVETPALAFDLAKTLIESTCRTVLDERSIQYSSADALPKLLKSTTRSLPFLPPAASAESKIRESLRQTLGGLSAAVQGICELRNRSGFASHGSGSTRPTMESTQALLVAAAADAIVGFLYRVHTRDRSLPRHLTFESHEVFNEYLDETWGVFIVNELPFRASEVLFQMDPEAYRVHLADFDSEDGRAATAALEDWL